ncbi:hypothetical protein [Streptacidiphilus carbonis]|uniref:hypothetical protein n=1 Tax=Streptacidiphilus carbonis TaxID=105422 RepID=UPI000A476213|nr:hypothetical protein [Streptacidiphilus carbonis]
MPELPLHHDITVTCGSQWNDDAYELKNDNGSLIDISTAEFEFVIRPNTVDRTQPGMVTVTSTQATAQGYITVTAATSTILVVLSPTATALLAGNAYPYDLWMNPGGPTAMVWVRGVVFSELAPAA